MYSVDVYYHYSLWLTVSGSGRTKTNLKPFAALFHDQVKRLGIL